VRHPQNAQNENSDKSVENAEGHRNPASDLPKQPHRQSGESESMDALSFATIGEDLFRLLDTSLREDIGRGDLTVGALPLRGKRAVGKLLCKADGVAAGFTVLAWLGRHALPIPSWDGLQVTSEVADGTKIAAGQVVAEIHGDAAGLLMLERSLLNLVSHLSGVATLTARYVELVRGTGAQICDTRKTLPGMRLAQKYAVRCGGGTVHRLGLFDEAMIKENHLALVGLGLEEAIQRVRSLIGGRRMTCEVENLDEFRSALTTGVDCILLDDFSLADMERAVELRDEAGLDVALEASGGVNLNTVGAIASTGVDRISIGALTHSSTVLDLSFKIALA
jgi:nicotinate-nucleotide pyrophosphorylase (carboxylating)